MAETLIIEQRKDCKCVGATATSGALRFDQQTVNKDTVTMRITFVPGNSCDSCGRPWKITTTRTNTDGENTTRPSR